MFLIMLQHDIFLTGPMWKYLQTAADQKVAQMMKFVLDRVENIVGKEDNAGYHHILLFPESFHKPSLPGPVKVWIW